MGLFQPLRLGMGGAIPAMLLFFLLPPAFFGQSRLLTLHDPVKQRLPQPFGGPLAVLGDLDGDGIREILVGSPYEFQKGAVYLFSGRTGRLLFQSAGTIFNESFGTAVADAGDVDADGISDFLVGDAEDGPLDEYIGSVCLFSGRTGRVLRRLTGLGSQAFFGTDVPGVGDVNFDGHADFMVSASGDDAGGRDAGSATVFSGIDGSVLFTFYGAAPGAELACTASAGDVNGDGEPDFLVGEGGGGVARVYSGRDGSLLFTLQAPQDYTLLGTSIRAFDDLNGDGISEFLASAPKDAAGEVRDGGLDRGLRLGARQDPAALRRAPVRAPFPLVSGGGSLHLPPVPGAPPLPQLT